MPGIQQHADYNKNGKEENRKRVEIMPIRTSEIKRKICRDGLKIQTERNVEFQKTIIFQINPGFRIV
jgi:hypothetical protein